ncbi:hypothetical protein [Bifidobacterium olomucense]|uniref:hypothetical protein n=1 Tax=Bifidobacterium olomucense TaxID=2675324 RepID=UPI00145E34CC|nr:hypothetical protein [Bifidobacterium sp. DSM 109959]
MDVWRPDWSSWCEDEAFELYFGDGLTLRVIISALPVMPTKSPIGRWGAAAVGPSPLLVYAWS